MKNGNYRTARSGIIHKYKNENSISFYDIYCCGIQTYTNIYIGDSTITPPINIDKYTSKPVTCKNCLRSLNKPKK